MSVKTCCFVFIFLIFVSSIIHFLLKDAVFDVRFEWRTDEPVCVADMAIRAISELGINEGCA